VEVADVAQAVVNHADDRVFRAFGDFRGGGDVGIFERGEQLLQLLRVALLAFAPPPERAFADDGDGDEGADENRPHDRAAFEEEFEDNVCEHIHRLILVVQRWRICRVAVEFGPGSVSDAGFEKADCRCRSAAANGV
jgi:uncharacterized protein YhfF